MENLKGKRLLLLGGSLWKESIARFAKEYDVTLIATGNNKNAGIFEISDEGYEVDSTNAAEMKKLIKQKNIDGVYMGGSEPVISAACVYLNELGMPCYCTKKQWDFLANKSNFKDLCIKHGLPVAKKYDVCEEKIAEQAESIDFPVITKPTDGSGSNGFSVCRNTEELIRGYKIAKDVSDTGGVIVEKFVKNSSILVFYTFSNGEMYFSGIEDKYPVKYEEQGSFVAGAHIFESKCVSDFRSKFESKLSALFKDIGIKEGPVWMEVFYDGEKYFFNEVGYRYSGSVTIYPVDYLYNINGLYSDLYYALTGKSCIKFDSLIPESLPRKKYYCMYSLHLLPGKICSVSGIDKMLSEENTVVIPITKNIGDSVRSSGTVGQVFAFVHFVFDTEEEYFATVEKIHRTIKILDENGNNMLVQKLDPKTQKLLI